MNTERCAKMLSFKALSYRQVRGGTVHFDPYCLPIAYPCAAGKLRDRQLSSVMTVAVRQ